MSRFPRGCSLIQYINSTIIHGDHAGAFSIAEDDSSGMNFDGEWARSYGDTVINEMVKTTDSSRDMGALSSAMSGTGLFRVVYTETHDLVAPERERARNGCRRGFSPPTRFSLGGWVG